MFLSKRGRFYYLWYVDDNGHRKKISTKSTTTRGALEFLKDFRATLASRTFERNGVDLDSFIRDLLAYSRTIRRPKTVRIYRTALSEFRRTVGNNPLPKLGVGHVQKFLSDKKPVVSEATLCPYYTHLSSALEVARKWGLISTNPAKLMPRPRVSERQLVYLSHTDSINLLQVVCDPDHRDLYVMAVSTGLRLGELTALRWRDLDFDQKLVRIQNDEHFKTKSGRNRLVPMSDPLLGVLKQRRGASPDGFVFNREGLPLRQEYVSKRFKRYLWKAGLDGRLTFHCLRHSFASWLVQAGVSIYQVSKLLGHSSVEVTQKHYASLEASELHGAVNKINLDAAPSRVLEAPDPTS